MDVQVFHAFPSFRQIASEPETPSSAAAARMVRVGLISRAQHEKDRRAHRVRLRVKGMRTLDQAGKIALSLQRRILTALPEARRPRFLDELATIAEACVAASENPEK